MIRLSLSVLAYSENRLKFEVLYSVDDNLTPTWQEVLLGRFMGSSDLLPKSKANCDNAIE